MKRRSINEDIESDRQLIKNTKFTGKYRLNDEAKYNVYQLVLAYNEAFSMMFDDTVKVAKAKICVENNLLEFWLTLIPSVSDSDADGVPKDLKSKAEQHIADIFGEYFKKARVYEGFINWDDLDEWLFDREERQRYYRAYSFNVHFNEKDIKDFGFILEEDEALEEDYDDDYDEYDEDYEDEYYEDYDME